MHKKTEENSINQEGNVAVLQQLVQLKTELSGRLERLSVDRSKSHSSDSTEQAVERENDEVIDQLENDTRTELLHVQQAIQRIEAGSYGICAKCGKAISPARLQAIPYSTLCINCAD